MRTRFVSLATMAALALAACGPAPGTPATTPRRSVAPRAGDPPRPAATATPGPLATAPTGLPTPAPTGPSPLAPATLTGLVRVPAGLVSNNGGGLIGNNSAGLIANNGLSYRLAQAAGSVPVAGLQVALLDAAGRIVNGASGRPLTATTDATGRYAFTEPLPAQNLVVRVTSGTGGSNGELSRLLVKGVKAADVDLASSLVARYVLTAFVATQPDPQATLDKLPADAEAATVALAAQAAPPANLAPDVVATAAAGLRGTDPAFDAQMEVVKRLLIAAGVSNLGEGLLGSEVYMRRLFGADIAPDGTLFVTADDDHLLWRVGPDGRLKAVAGNGEKATATTPDERAGRQANAVALDFVWTVHVDGHGRPVLNENEHGVWRIEPDGTIAVLHTPEALAAAFGTAGPGRGTHVRADGTVVGIRNEAVWALPPGGAAVKLADAKGVRSRSAFTELPGGKGWLALDFAALSAIAPDGTVTRPFVDDDPRVLASQFSQRNDPMLDARGNYFYVAAADMKLHRRRPDGTDEAVWDRAGLRFGLAWAREGADGKLYLSDCDMGDNLGGAIVRRVANGASTVLAGIDGLPKGFTADGRIALLYPGGLDVAPDGTLWIADAGALLRVDPGGQPALVAAKGTVVPGLGAVTFTGVRRLATGKLAARAFNASFEAIVVQGDAGWTVGLSTPKAIANAWNIVMNAWDAHPDGTLVASVHGYGGASFEAQATVLRRKPGGAQETLVSAAAGFVDLGKLVFAADGQLWLRGRKADGSYGRYLVADDGAVTAAPADARVPEVLDAQGRALEGDAPTGSLGNYGNRQIWRKSAAGAWSPFAGAGTPLFGGATLDDSIGWAEDLRVDAAGNLYVRDVLRRQVRRIPKDKQ